MLVFMLVTAYQCPVTPISRGDKNTQNSLSPTQHKTKETCFYCLHINYFALAKIQIYAYLLQKNK